MSFKEELEREFQNLKENVKEIKMSLKELKDKIQNLENDSQKKEVKEQYKQFIDDIEKEIKMMFQFIIEEKGFEIWRNILIHYLQERIKSNQVDYKDFKKAVDEYKELGFDLGKILELAMRNSQGKSKEKMGGLYEEFRRQNISKMYETLNKLGYALRREKAYEEVVSAFRDQSFRIMEKTRHGLRDEVEYMIMRIFVANGKEIPRRLAEAFNPIYPEEIFKTFIYSFLCGILGKSSEDEEKEMAVKSNEGK